VSGVANGTKSFSKMASSINGDNNSLVGAYAALAANIFAVTAAFNALKNAAEVEQVIRGLDASGTKVGLTYSNVTARVQEAADGLLSMEQSARSSAQVLAAGFKADQVVRITEAAKNASFALGRDMQESMDRLTRGIIKLEPELLDELGIMVRLDEATSRYARELGKTASQLTVAEKQQAFLNAALAESELKFSGIADAAGGASGFTKLSATFSNLINTIFSGINKLASPIASLFSKSPVALLGGMLLFASSIKGQLMPGLVNSATAMSKMAKEANELALANIANKNSTVKYSDSLKTLFSDVKGGSFTLDTAAQKLKELREEKDALANGPRTAGTPGKLDRSRADISTVRRGMGELNQAGAQTALSDSVLLASNGKLKDSYRTLGQSIAQYSLGVRQASVNNSIFTVTANAAKISLFGLSAAAKVAGVALLTILPWLGLIAIAVGGLVAVWNYFKQSIYGKEFLEAEKAFKETLKTLKKLGSEYEKIAESSAALASQETARSRIVSNALQEQVTQLEALAAAKKRNNDIDAGGTRDSLKNQIPNKEAFKDAELGKSVQGLRDTNIPENIDALNRAAEAQGGWKNVVKESIEANDKFIASLKETIEANKGVSEIGSSFVEAEKSIQDYYKALVPSTPYDGMLTTFTKLTGELSLLNIKLGQGTISLEKYAAVLTGIGSKTSSIVSAETLAQTIRLQDELQKIKELEKDIAEKRSQSDQSLGGRARKQEIIKELVDQIRSSESIIKDLSINIVTNTVRDIAKHQEKIQKLQIESILMEGQLALAQAHLSSISSYNDLSGNGTAAKLKAENAIKSLQASQLSLQADELEVEIKIKAISLDVLKLTIDKIARTTELLGMTTQVRIQEELTAIAIERSSKPGKARLDELDRLSKNLTEQLLKVKEYDDGVAANARNQAAAENARMKARAALSGSYSDEYIELSRLLTKAKTYETIFTNQVSAIEGVAKRLKMLADIQNIISGEAESTLDTYNRLSKEQADSIEHRTRLIEQQAAVKIKDLEAQKRLAFDRNSSDKVTQQLFDALIAQANNERDIKVGTLDVEDRLARLQAIGLTKDIERLEVAKKYTDVLKEQASIVESAALADIESAAEAKRRAIKATGRELTAVEERSILQDSLQDQITAATNVAKIKELAVKAEYALLKAQYGLEKIKLYNVMTATAIELDREKAKGAEANPGTIAGLEANISFVKDTIPLLDAVIGNLGEQERLAIDAIYKAIQAKRDALEASTAPKYLTPTEAPSEFLQSRGRGESARESLVGLSKDLDPYIEKLKKLGPDGEYVAAMAEGSLVIADSMLKIRDASSSTADKLNGVAAIIGQIASITKAGSDAKIANIDREIAAEQQRDGKSEASVSRIKAMESKKDSIARKSFEVQKKLQLAQAIMSTAAAVTGALAAPPFPGSPWNIAMAIGMGALGAAQIGIIAGTSYQSSASSSASVASPSSVSVGSRGNSVDLARNNTNVGGELGYLQGNQGTGANSSNFRNRAYGGYGHAGMIVGEKGPEIFVPDSPGTMVANDNAKSQAPINANINIHAIDAEGVEQVLTNQKGHIIGMLREAANSNGQNFLENINIAKYRRGGRRI
jgi:hypothetical protein